jgi:serine protease
MKYRSLLALCAVFIAAASSAGDGTIVVPQGAALVPNRYIVVFADDIGFTRGAEREIESLAQSFATQYGASVDRVYAYALRGAVMRMNEVVARRVSGDPRVAYVEQDALSYVNGDQSNPTWGIDRVDERALPLDDNYHFDYDGSGVNVYVIDTGIRTTHVDFGGRAVWGRDCTVSTTTVTAPMSPALSVGRPGAWRRTPRWWRSRSAPVPAAARTARSPAGSTT